MSVYPSTVLYECERSRLPLCAEVASVVASHVTSLWRSYRSSGPCSVYSGATRTTGHAVRSAQPANSGGAKESVAARKPRAGSNARRGAPQVWRAVMGWYLEQRRYLENEVRKYSDPPSDRLLPDLPAHARCGPLRAPAGARMCVQVFVHPGQAPRLRASADRTAQHAGQHKSG